MANKSFSYICFFLGVILQTTIARDAMPMTPEFFNQILFTVVGTPLEGGNSSNPLDSWEIQTEWNWEYAKQLEQNETKEFPFIFCDENLTRTALERRQVMARQSQNMLNETVTIYTTENVTCAVALGFASIAETLGELIVQPIGFIMKLNSGSVDFVSDESKAREYAINFCPGLPFLDLETFTLETIELAIGLIDFFLSVPEVEPFIPDLLQLKDELDQNPNFCDATLLESVESEQADVDYVILRLTTPEDGFAPEACFLLLALGLAHAPEICFIERRNPFVVENDEAQWISQSGVPEERPFFDMGITGKGQVIAVSDTGLDLQNCYFRDSQNPLEFGTGFNNVSRKVVQYVDFVDKEDYTSGHGTHVCGTIAGRKSEDGISETDGMVDGVARDAKLAFFDVGRDDRLRIPWASRLFEPGRLAGALTHSCSWGSKKAVFYANQAKDFDRYLYNDETLAVVVAAGNKGPSGVSVRSPGNAKNVITVGASTSAGNDINGRTPAVNSLASFSSRGPSMDERIKPDVVAPGSYLLSAGARPAPSCDPPKEGDLPKPGERDSPYGIVSMQGTSMATPVVSGSVALIRQYFNEGWYGDGSKGSAEGKIVSGTLLKAILVNGAQPLSGYAFQDVDNNQGFGRISLIDSLPLAGENDLTAEFYDGEIVTQGGAPAEYEFTVSKESTGTCEDVGVSVTLTWADPPGYVSCLRCLLNDLDLLVKQTADDKTTNHFPNGRDNKDDTNNVERVRFFAKQGNVIRVTVSAANLESTEQKFSLTYAYGCVSSQSTPSLAIRQSPIIAFGIGVFSAALTLFIIS